MPILQRLQRQFPEEFAGFPDPFQDGRAGFRGPDHACRRDLHLSLLHPVGDRRRDRRPLRQGDGGPTPQARRNRGGRDRGDRVLGTFGADPVHGAVPVRRDLGAVRADQIRNPSRSPRRKRIAGRQRAGRERHLHRHPLRDHRRRPRLKRRRRPRLVRRPDDGVRIDVLDRGAAHPVHRPRGAEPRHRLQHRPLDLRRAARSLQPETAVVGRPGGELVLARWRRRAVPAAALGEERAGRIGRGRHRLSRHLLHRDRDRLRPRFLARQRTHRPHPHGFRRPAARRVRAASRLDHVGGGRRRAWARRRRSPAPRHRTLRRHRSRRPRRRRRPLHRALVFRRAGLGRLGRAAPASSPP